MRRVAFYSYKGGTGRTLALANIARFAASIGKRVIALDMDLEAPGLTYKLLPDGHRDRRSRGLVGCLLDTIQGSNVPPDLAEYVIDIEVSASPLIHNSDQGWLKLMPAGVVPSPNYFGELRRLNLDARTADGTATELLRALINRLEQDFAPDLLLIDARTGITGTNTLVLSELVDAVFAFFLDLPEQLDGVRMVLRSLAPLTRDAALPVQLNGVATRVRIDELQFRHGWVESDADRERTQRLDRFFTEPGPLPAYTLDAISLFAIHHDSGLVGGEYLVLDNIQSAAATTSPLGWDYARLAAASIDDPATVGRAVASLTASDDQRSWEVAALLSGNHELRAGPGTLRSSTEIGPGDGGIVGASSDMPLLDRVTALRAEADRDPAMRARFAALSLELAAAQRSIGTELRRLHPPKKPSPSGAN